MSYCESRNRAAIPRLTAESTSGDTSSRSFAVTCSAVSRRASRMSQHRVAVEAARSSEHRLDARRRATEDETHRGRLAIDAPPGESARGFFDVPLGVVTLAEREQLHHFAREILVRSALAVLDAVEIDEHRRILGDRVQQDAEAAKRVGAQRGVLAVHEARDPHLWLARHEMVVPEKRHPLGERRARDRHFLDPPRAKREALADLRLDERLALLGRTVLARRPQRRGVGGRCGGRRRRNGPRLAQQLVDGGIARHPGVHADFRVRRSETCACEKVTRVVVAEHRARSECRCGIGKR